MIKLVLVILIIIIIILIINTNKGNRNKNNKSNSTNTANSNTNTNNIRDTRDYFNITNAGIPERVVANQRNDVYDMSCSNDISPINDDLDKMIQDAITKRGRTNDKKKLDS